jgi:superfamily II DNA or RNA helicase
LPDTIQLPPLIVGPISYPIGHLQHLLRESELCEVVEIAEVLVSPRVREPLHTLSNTERIVITSRRKIARPAEADGVLQKLEDGTLRWVSHKRIDEFLARAAQMGWQALAAEIASSWDGKLAFRAEKPSPDGTIAAGNEGLRPPQLGALHAIGAHWSLQTVPATVVMPTGTGKTETMLAALAAYIRGTLLVIVPWDLLRGQTARKFLNFGLLRQLGVLPLGVPNPIVGYIAKRPESDADLAIFSSCNVVIATASSLSMGSALAIATNIAARCKTLIIDEAHHVAATNWAQFRAAFDRSTVLQFTATPFRRDSKLVDGQVIFNYPLRAAQRDGYFKKIVFEPIYEIDQRRADRAIATAAVSRLRKDLNADKNHLLMARCINISRAEEVIGLYREIATDMAPMLIHSEMDDTDTRLLLLRAGRSRIVVCVNMLGEGFDLPQLKIAAIHDMHRSLAVLLQFVGRFTRTAGATIGDATVVANIADPDVSGALERLYSEDADWNEVLSELSSEAAREHAALVGFLNASQRLDVANDDDVPISNHLLRPVMSTVTYRASEFHPQRFHEGLSDGRIVHRVWLHTQSNTLYFVTRTEPALRWTRSKEVRDREWALFVLHFSEAQGLLYLASTDHSSMFADLAQAVCGDVTLISGDQVFRALGNIHRLIFQNVGVKKHGRRNLSFALYTGADVATALGIAERAGSVKNNLSGTGWENGNRVSIGCSYKGRVWSREQGTIPAFVRWCELVGTKLIDDTIDTKQILENVLIPEEVFALPAKEVLGIEWPVELLQLSEEKVVLDDGQEGLNERPLYVVELVYVRADIANNRIVFDLSAPDSPNFASFALVVGGDVGFRVEQLAGNPIRIRAGARYATLAEFLSDYPPLVRFVDLCELDGNLLIRQQSPQDLVINLDHFEAWEWGGIDITKESYWKNGVERRDSIQFRAAQHLIEKGFEVVFDDDSAGEAADLVALKEMDDHIRLALVHCKFSGGQTPGERVKDVVEVCSQAVRSAKWKWRFRDLIRHILNREESFRTELRPTRFIRGQSPDLNRFIKTNRFKEVRVDIFIVQPGISIETRSADQNMVLAAAMTYLKETVGTDLTVVCSK